MTARAYIGTSGWNYDAWKAGFYRGVPRRQWLAYCATRFTALEVNATFYRLPSHATFRRWREATPPGFRFAIKGHRYLTHNKKLADPLPAIRRERARAGGLGEKLAAVVWQLPEHFHKHLERLEGFARALARGWAEVRHAVEFRHPSWFDPEVAACLAQYGIANCQSDAADWPRWDAVTTDMVYVRLHGREVTYASPAIPLGARRLGAAHPRLARRGARRARLLRQRRARPCALRRAGAARARRAPAVTPDPLTPGRPRRAGGTLS